jgi:hypothetical protein
VYLLEVFTGTSLIIALSISSEKWHQVPSLNCAADDYPYWVQKTTFYQHERRTGSLSTQLELLLSYPLFLLLPGQLRALHGRRGAWWRDPFNISRVLRFTGFWLPLERDPALILVVSSRGSINEFLTVINNGSVFCFLHWSSLLILVYDYFIRDFVLVVAFYTLQECAGGYEIMGQRLQLGMFVWELVNGSTCGFDLSSIVQNHN